MINDSKATCLIVGLGAPKQEVWIVKHRHLMPHVKVYMGVGATIDYEADAVRRAPRWMAQNGLEWVYRMTTEPRRYWRRYARTLEYFWLVLLRPLRALSPARRSRRNHSPHQPSKGSLGVDKILFGDNQFFGVNHMSEEKARQQAMRFQDLDAIMRVLQSAHELGAGGFMCTTHDRIAEVCDRIRAEPGQMERLQLLSEHALRAQIRQCGDGARLFRRAPQIPAQGQFRRYRCCAAARRSRPQDMKAIIGLLVDAEMKMFHGLPTPVIFLQNVVTDLVIGLALGRCARRPSPSTSRRNTRRSRASSP